MKAIAIYPDKTEEVVIEGLEDMQQIVDGWIEPVDISVLKEGRYVSIGTIYVNEEFTYHFPHTPENVNHLASDLAGLVGGRRDLWMNGILGPVVVTGPLDNEGYDTDVPSSLLGAIFNLSKNTPGQELQITS